MIVASIANVRGLDKTTNAFRLGVIRMAERLGTDPDWHVAVMSVESGGTFSPSIRNPHGGATGLIQFMPATAKSMGTTTDELAALTAEEQLVWVERYYEPFAGRMHSVEDVYMATFMPSMIGRGGDNVISRAGEKVYEVNKGFDLNHDGTITNGEVGSTARSRLQNAEGRIDVLDEEDGAEPGDGSDDRPPFSSGSSGPDSSGGPSGESDAC